nr:1-aminocyclopropane-1-carboxylate oxidase homolog 1-like [Ziziphus jujuba var. spinosa]
MAATNKVPSKTNQRYDRLSEVKAFDETKAGVKGLVDAGIAQIPRIFHHPPNDINNKSVCNDTQLIIPVIDLGDISKDSVKRQEIVKRVGEASETWGFFQVVNHGIPVGVLEEIKDGARRFFEQDNEVKKEVYTRDITRKMVYNSNFDLYTSTAANWRDTFFSYMAPSPPHPEELPEACREEMFLYTKQIMKLGVTLLELLSEALGLNKDHLKEMECGEGLAFVGHYYPVCPQPELTLGTTKHTDNDFLTVLLQDHIGGLQVFHNSQWVDVPPVPGALVVNIGDLLQLISNDKFKSVEHRVLANHLGPRISVACFFSTSFQPSSRLYGPIKELLSEDNPPVYRETTVNEYVTYSFQHNVEGTSPLQHFKL